MKQEYINEAKRFQKLAGIIIESEEDTYNKPISNLVWEEDVNVGYQAQMGNGQYRNIINQNAFNSWVEGMIRIYGPNLIISVNYNKKQLNVANTSNPENVSFIEKQEDHNTFMTNQYSNSTDIED
jgi:putative salt-induced outer membrane protein YdiY